MTSDFPARALVDGFATPLEEARLPITDDGVARGDGAFETIGVWDGMPFRLEDHLGRLDASLEQIMLPPSDRAALVDDIGRILDDLTLDAALRCYVTASGTRIVTLSPQPQRPPVRTLQSRPAPWIQPTDTYPPAGAKTMSYGPNMTATRAARHAGFDDALLVGHDGVVLEGPTFSVLWVVHGVLHAVPLERGIVDSISRRSLLEIAAGGAVPTVEAEATVEEVASADEVLVCSSVRPVAAVERIDEHVLDGPVPIASRLREALEAARRRSI